MKYVLNIAKIALVVFLGLFIFLLLRENSFTGRDIESVKESLLHKIDVDGMEPADNHQLKKYYGLDSRDYEGAFLYVSRDTMDVRELLVIRVRDKDQLEEVERAVENRKETQKNNFDGYGAEQMKLLEESELSVKGTYLFFAISPNAVDMKKAFYQSLKN